MMKLIGGQLEKEVRNLKLLQINEGSLNGQFRNHNLLLVNPNLHLKGQNCNRNQD